MVVPSGIAFKSSKQAGSPGGRSGRAKRLELWTDKNWDSFSQKLESMRKKILCVSKESYFYGKHIV